MSLGEKSNICPKKSKYYLKNLKLKLFYHFF